MDSGRTPVPKVIFAKGLGCAQGSGGLQKSRTGSNNKAIGIFEQIDGFHFLQKNNRNSIRALRFLFQGSFSSTPPP